MPLATFGVATSSGHIASFLTTDDLNTARQIPIGCIVSRSQTGSELRMHTSIDRANDLNNTGRSMRKPGIQWRRNCGGDIRSTDGTLVTRGNKGWTNETHQGGFYMSDDDWVRSLNKGIYTASRFVASVRADGRLSVGEVLQLDAVNSVV
jgi:hypothetical protein